MNRSGRRIVRNYASTTSRKHFKNLKLMTAGATIGSVLGGGAVVVLAEGKDGDKDPSSSSDLVSRLMAEFSGTFILVAGGCGVVCAAKYASAGLHPLVYPRYGVRRCLAVFATRDVSGASQSGSATTVTNRFDSLEEAPLYMAAQTLGAGAAGYMNYLIFRNGISALEDRGLTRGTPKSISILNGSFGMYRISKSCELDCVRLALKSSRLHFFRTLSLPSQMRTVLSLPTPLHLCGTTVAVLVAALGGVTGCGMNPARDLGPRLASAVAGFGPAAMQSAWLYTAGPIVGAILGGRIYMETIGKRLKEKAEAQAIR